MTIEEIEESFRYAIEHGMIAMNIKIVGILLSEVKRLEHEFEISEACTSYLKTDIEILKKGIEKHREFNKKNDLTPKHIKEYLGNNDEELYKLLEDK